MIAEWMVPAAFENAPDVMLRASGERGSFWKGRMRARYRDTERVRDNHPARWEDTEKDRDGGRDPHRDNKERQR